jgi:hypothetical protein
MTARALICIVALVALSFLAGCGANYYHHGPTPLEENWGRSYETAKYNQIVNPEAEKNLEPVVGLNGWAAEENMAQYLKKGEAKAAGTEFGLVTIKQPYM